MNLGVVGGGQLGRMLALSAVPLGIRTTFLDPLDSACAKDVGTLICAAYDDPSAISQLAERSDVVTFEFEIQHPLLLSNSARTLLGYLR